MASTPGVMDPGLDRAAGQTWLCHRRAEAKLIACTALTLAVLSERQFSPVHVSAYATAAVGLAAASGASPAYLINRCLLVLAPLGLAALLGWAQGTVNPWLLLSRGMLALLFLTTLVAATRPADLIGALQWMRLPRAIPMLAAMLFRFVPLLDEEWQRMEVARLSRTPGWPKRTQAFTLARQMANLLLRAWHRAERMQAAMDSRGFTGNYRRKGSRNWAAADLALVGVAIALAVAIRWSSGG